MAIVTDTAASTEMGKIQQGVQAAKEDQERTPLAQKLDAFGAKLTWAIGAICLAVWGCATARIEARGRAACSLHTRSGRCAK